MTKLRRRVFAVMLISSFSLFSALAKQQEPNISVLDSLRAQLNQPSVSDSERLALYSLAAAELESIPLDSAERYIKLHLEEAIRQGDHKEVAVAYGNLGELHERKGEYEASLRYRIRMIRMADSLGDSSLLFMAHSDLGNYLLDRQEYGSAISYAKAALDHLASDEHKQRSTSLYNLGIAYSYAGHLDSAKQAFEKGIEIARLINDVNAIGLHYSGLSMVNYYAGDLENGIEQVHTAISYFERSKNVGQLLGAYVSLSAYLYELNRKEEAVQYSHKALKLAREISSTSQELTILNNLSIVYYDLGQYKEAYEHLDSMVVLRDSLFDLEKMQAVAELRTKYDLHTKQRDLELLREKSRSDELRLEEQGKYNLVLALLTVLAIVLVVVLWRNNRLRKRANQVLVMEKKMEDKRRVELELTNQKLQLENSKAQFEILKNQVDPHFMFNALNTLTALVESEPDKASSFVRALSTLFRNMLELRAEHLVPLEEEFKHTEAYLHLQQVRFGESLLVKTDLDERSLNCYLPPFSLQQVVENAIKHNRIFQREPLMIEISSTPDRVTVRNKINQRQDHVVSTGTGIRNIRERYALLGQEPPTFEVEEGYYIVHLPLQP